jgi:glycopeptide antibiotics resistance protein
LRYLYQNILSSKLVFGLYCLIIILLVTLPINTTGELNDVTIISFRGDYFFHVILFLPWPLFQLILKDQLGVWIIMGLIFAIGSELIQLILTYRAFNINDLIANSLGIFIGFILHLIFKGFKIRN